MRRKTLFLSIVSLLLLTGCSNNTNSLDNKTKGYEEDQISYPNITDLSSAKQSITDSVSQSENRDKYTYVLAEIQDEDVNNKKDLDNIGAISLCHNYITPNAYIGEMKIVTNNYDNDSESYIQNHWSNYDDYNYDDFFWNNSLPAVLPNWRSPIRFHRPNNKWDRPGRPTMPEMPKPNQPILPIPKPIEPENNIGTRPIGRPIPESVSKPIESVRPVGRPTPESVVNNNLSSNQLESREAENRRQQQEQQEQQERERREAENRRQQQEQQELENREAENRRQQEEQQARERREAENRRQQQEQQERESREAENRRQQQEQQERENREAENRRQQEEQQARERREVENRRQQQEQQERERREVESQSRGRR